MHLLRLLLAAALLPWTAAAAATPLGEIKIAKTPLAGDWSLDQAGDEIGYHDAEEEAFHLCSNRYASTHLTCVSYLQTNDHQGLPLVGRWEAGDARDRPALYDPATGKLHVYSYSDCLPEHCYGHGGLRLDATYALRVRGATPVRGDWDDSGVDSVALLLPVPPQVHGGAQHTRILFFSDGFTAVTADVTLTFDVSRWSPLSGDWPETQHVGDSLGFYLPDRRLLVLFDGHQVARLLPSNNPYQGLIAFSGSWSGLGDTVGLYYPPPPACPVSGCHRVDLLEVQYLIDGTILPYPNPHLDSRFPDDTGDPDS